MDISTSKIISISVAVVVGILMVVYLIAPSIQLYDEGQSVNYSNNVANSNLIAVSQNVDYVNFDISYTVGDSTVTVNGESMSIGTYNCALLVSDVFTISIDRGTEVSEDSPKYSITGFNVNGNSGVIEEISGSSASGVVITISCRAGDIVAVVGDNTYTCSPEHFIAHASPEGTYKKVRQWDTGQPKYVNNIEQLFGSTIINTNNLGYAWFFGSAGQIAGQDITMNFAADAVSGYADLYSFDRLQDYTFGTELGTNSDGTPFTPYFVFMPVSVQALTEADSLNSTMLWAMGLMVVVMLVVLVARVFMEGRN